MSVYSALQYALFVLIVTVLVKPLGGYLDRVFYKRKTALDPLLIPLERWVYRFARVDAAEEMPACQYAASFVIFGLICTLFLYLILRCQRFLPWFFAEYHTTPLTPELS